MKKLIATSLILSLPFTSYAEEKFTIKSSGPKCEALFKFGLAFSANRDTGKLTLNLAGSKHQALAESFNQMATILLGRSLKLNELSAVTKRYLDDASGDPYFVKLARAYDLSLKIDQQGEFAKKIPKEGAVLFLLNHPANGRETMAFAAAVSLIRPDVKVALTALLKNFPDMTENAFFFELGGTAEAKAANKLTRQAMDDWARQGGISIVHASGEVSLKKFSNDKDYAMDPEWKIGMALMMQNNPDIQVIPVFLDGQSSSVFQKVKAAVGISKALDNIVGSVFHIRELANGQGQSFGINVSSPIKAADLLKQFDGDLHAMMQYLRARTYALKGRFEKTKDSRIMEPIAKPTDPELIRQDVSRMKVLTEEKGLQVLVAEGKDIPNVLRELGRIREVTFRSVGEASGKSLDNDIYDQHYHHVMVYKPDTNAIIGAYRIAFSDKVIAKHGLNGLYNRSLFEYSNLVTDIMPKSLELGRAIVNIELAERDRRSAIYFLPLMWKGIAKVLEQNPEYTKLMGPASISNQYSDVSKVLILGYLMKNYPSEYARIVKGRKNFTPSSPVLKETLALVEHIKSLKELNALVTDIDGVGIPSLITSYDKLGARYLAFNFDPDFNSVDGMLVVDLLKTDRTELIKYFGEDGLRNFLNYHGTQYP